MAGTQEDMKVAALVRDAFLLDYISSTEEMESRGEV